MARLFQRRCVLIAQPPDPRNFVETVGAGLIIDGLRVKFDVQKTLEKSPNRSSVSVYNLSPDHRAQLQKKGTKVFLQAGYADTVQQIFSGDARLVENVQDGSDWITKFTLGDGERAFRLARFSETFSPGATVEGVVRALADAMGLDASDAVAQTVSVLGPGSLESYPTGYAFHGRARDALDQLLSSLGLTWSIQDGRLQVLRKTRPLAGETVVLSPSSGLIGSPAFGTPKEKDGPARLTVKTQLEPRIKCGGVVVVESRSVNGRFKVFTLAHAGDTAGGDWMTTLEVEAL